MRKNNKKGSPGVVSVIVIIYFMLAMLNAVDVDIELVIAPLVILVVIIVAIIALAKAVKANSKKTGMEHSHDRLTADVRKMEDPNSFEHYRKQLDAFLSAGIIDKAEYRTLYEKYRKTLK